MAVHSNHTIVSVVGFDHLVLKCADVETSLAWYCDQLGLEPVRVEEWRAGLAFFPSVRAGLTKTERAR